MLSRRAMIVATGLAGVGALAGCSAFDPTVVSTQRPVGSPTSTGLPFRAEGLRSLGQVESHALGVQGKASSLKLTKSQIALLAWVAQSVRVQRDAVTQGTPVAATEKPTPLPSVPPASGSSWPVMLSQVSASSVDHLTRAQATRGLDSLLWASLAGFARTAGVSPAGTQPRSPVNAALKPSVPTEQDALAQVISGVHALCFAIELALVPVPASDPARGRINDTWTSWLQTRDDLSQTLRKLGGTPPGSKAPYDIDAPQTVTAAVSLVATIETRFLPTLGILVAAADSTHGTALNLLTRTTTHAASFGGTLQVWPGWPTS